MTPDARRQVIAEASKLAAAGRHDEANALIMGALGPDAPSDPTPARAAPAPAPVPLTPAARRAADRAAHAGTVLEGSPEALAATTARRADHVIRLVVDTVANDPDTYPAVPVVSPSPKVKWPAALGRLLKTQFAEDPALRSYEAAAVLLQEVRVRQRPWRINRDRFEVLIGAARRAPLHPVEVYDRVVGGWTNAWVGLSKHRRDDDGFPIITRTEETP